MFLDLVVRTTYPLMHTLLLREPMTHSFVFEFLHDICPTDEKIEEILTSLCSQPDYKPLAKFEMLMSMSFELKEAMSDGGIINIADGKLFLCSRNGNRLFTVSPDLAKLALWKKMHKTSREYVKNFLGDNLSLEDFQL
ncbi:MAG: hypothetical protein EAZ74_05745 [Alphaproteobacteria bacterium]|nr:MAG: hypothetical protein EAY76_00955 [Alphaproteobacteria bacterium]TAF13436.1 MAG: hypothetical protein EAZ74_05745 [Alphaproteobacteria bacterium]TAF40781.1 MAG: hypothetical protein EAZ66_02580 [Alphaproteobacteria bacterium]TAF76951.1 MAG: hypothetical protein EAZ52_02195 [Alphaproteobacteria bacterium]